MPHRLLLASLLPLVACAAHSVSTPSAPNADDSYAIIVSKATLADPGWARVVAALKVRHPQAQVVSHDGAVALVQPALAAQHPRYTAFVATPAESSRDFVAEVSRLARHLNADPYTDTCWGIVTGFDAANALEMAQCPGFTITHASGNTAFETRCVPSGLWFDELKAGLQVEVKADGSVERRQGPTDSTAGIVQGIQDCDLLITSSHGSERSWQLGHVYRNGFVLSKGGELTGKDTQGNVLQVENARDKAWMPVGNCLVGHIDGPDALALAMMKDGHVRAAAAYTVPTWYGYAGWGTLDYFVEQPGRYTYAEAVWANRLALEHRLYSGWPKTADWAGKPGSEAQLAGSAVPGFSNQDGTGLLYDRDVLAFYGDPATRVSMPKKWCAYAQVLTEESPDKDHTTWTLKVTGNAGADSFATVNNNGSQRGGRPIIQFLPHAIDPASVMITAGAELKPVIGPDWILVPRPTSYAPGQALEIRFTAKNAASH